MIKMKPMITNSDGIAQKYQSVYMLADEAYEGTGSPCNGLDDLICIKYNLNPRLTAAIMKKAPVANIHIFLLRSLLFSFFTFSMSSILY